MEGLWKLPNETGQMSVISTSMSRKLALDTALYIRLQDASAFPTNSDGNTTFPDWPEGLWEGERRGGQGRGEGGKPCNPS